MRYVSQVVAGCLLGGCLATTLAAEPIESAKSSNQIAAGWESDNGQVLLGELNCVSCHAADANTLSIWQTATSGEPQVKKAPNLESVGARITPQYLRAYLTDPTSVKPGATMPDLLHGRNPAERDRLVDALVHFLVSLDGPMDQRASGSSLAQIEQGRALYHSVGCVACHPAADPPPKHKSDPNLLPDDDEEQGDQAGANTRPSIPHGKLAMKTTVDALAAFLADPLQSRPSGRMPKFHLVPGEAKFLAAYLLRDQYSDQQTAPGVGLDVALYKLTGQSMPDFDKLQPVAEGVATQMDLASIQLDGAKIPNSNFALRFSGILDVPTDGEYRFWTRSDDGTILKIDGRVVVDNDGMHPPTEKEGRVQLRRGRHVLELGFTQGGGGFELATFWQPPGADKKTPIPEGVLMHSTAAMIPEGVVDFRVDPAKAEEGRQLFGSLGCVSCHQLKAVDAPPKKATPLASLDTTAAGNCIAGTVAKDRPLYALSSAQRQALAVTIEHLKSPQANRVDAQAKLDHWMTVLNCYRCHQRGGKGGPDPDREAYFSYDIVVDLGEEGRLPPPLSETGAKLTDDGFADVLINGEKYRTYMAARMPMFGKSNIGHLPELFREADAGKIPPYQPEFSARLVDDGRTLAGKKHLACINCHAWGPYRIPGAEGLDFLKTPRRLQPAWFHKFLVDPQQLKPRTRMPTSWPQGKSFFPEIQGGEVDKQIDAIWAWLSVGEKGGMPHGLSPDDDSLLIPSDEPIVFRTFLDQVGAHSILVGFRQRTHVAFDANRVRTVLAWTGNFVTTKHAWDGRAGQYAKIDGSNVLWLPEGPPFAQLSSLDAEWPKDVPKQKLGATRTPPGWKFRGYALDENRLPTFLYEMNGVRIEESPSSGFRQDAAVLTRKFVLRSNTEPQDLYLRLAAGQTIVSQGEQFVVDDRVRWSVASSPPASANIRRSGDAEELILPIPFERVRDGFEANVTIVTAW